MPKINLIGKVVDVISIGDKQMELKVLVDTNKKSFYLVKAPTSQSVLKGKTIELTGTFYTKPHNGSEVLVVECYSFVELCGNVKNKAFVYNVLGFLVNDNGRFHPNKENAQFTYQRISISNGSNKEASYYDVSFWGDYGVNLYDKNLLNSNDVRRILISGKLVTEYKKSDNGHFFNKRISVEDFQVVDFNSQDVSEKTNNTVNKTQEDIDDKDIPF